MNIINKYLSEGKIKTKGTIGKILNMLEGSKFEKWYEKDFIDYISGDKNAKSREEILSDIKSMLK